MARPTVMTPETVKRLEDAFLMGCSDLEACLYADISKSTLYAYQEANPEFSERKEILKQNPFMKARRVLLAALDDDDRITAHKILERKDGTKVKQEISGPDGGDIGMTWKVEVVDAKDANTP